jgi:tetratricopeptide (TPR) repeat protein
LDYENKALAIRQQLYGEIHPDVSNSYDNIGQIYENEGKFDQALEYYKKTLAIDLKTVGERHPNTADSYYNIATICNYKGEHETVFKYLEKSLAIRLSTFGENSPAVANCYHHMGTAYDGKAEYGRAFEFYNKALTIGIRSLGEFHPDVAQIYQSLAELSLKQNNFPQALAYAQGSLLSLAFGFKSTNAYSNPPVTGISSAIDMLASLKLKAEIFNKLYSRQSHDRNDIEMSLSTYQLASDLIDKIRSGYQEEGSKLLLGEKAAKIYDAAIQASLQVYDLTKQAPYQNQAFFFAEKSKAAVLSQALQESRAKEFAGIPPDSLEKERNLKIDLAFYETDIQKKN